MTNQDILNGSQLIVEFTPDGASGATVTAFSTSHSFNISTSQEDILTKEYGKYPGKIIGSVEWEVTCENLASDTGIDQLITAFQTQAGNGKPVTLKFGKISTNDWNNGKGTLQSDGTLNGFQGVNGNGILAGQAIITALSVNAPAGENATISATFTGVGAPTSWSAPANP